MTPEPTSPIPVTVLTGWLGAGKTTLLNRLLASGALDGAALIVNEFGEVGLDGLLVEGAGEGIVELNEGCVCCTVRGDLVDALVRLSERIPLPRRIVIETTGLADPTPILAAMGRHPDLLARLRLSGVVCVADALSGPDNLRHHAEARRQVAVADRIALSKGDLADPAPLERALTELNPRAAILDAATAAPALVLEMGLRDPVTGLSEPERWLGAADADSHVHGHAHGAVASFALRHEAPIRWADLEAFLEFLGTERGLLRLKGIVRLAEDEARPLVVHGVRGFLHPPATLANWPDGTPRATRLVVIGEGLSERRVRDLFAAFCRAPAPDAPDRTALLDNPLSVAGRRF